MPSGDKRIGEYQSELTPEQRSAHARAANLASQEAKKRNARNIKDIRTIARLVNKAPAGPDLKAALARLGIENENLTNAAGIVLAVYQAALNGDMKAVEKWESYVGQADKSKAGGAATPFVQIVCDFPRPAYSMPDNNIVVEQVEPEEVNDDG